MQYKQLAFFSPFFRKIRNYFTINKIERFKYPKHFSTSNYQLIKMAQTAERTLTELLKEYRLDEHVSVNIIKTDGQIRYSVLGTELSKREEKFKQILKDWYKITLEYSARGSDNDESKKKILKDYAMRYVKEMNLKIKDEAAFERVMRSIYRDMVGYRLIDPLMRDPNIEDIHCTGIGRPIFITHKEFGTIPTNLVFYIEKELDEFALRLAYLGGRHLSIATPRIDATLPNRSRLQLSYSGEAAAGGTNFTIRRFKEEPYTIIDLISLNTLTAEMAAHLWYGLENKLSALVVGPTASGKTTTMNAIAMLFHPDSKIVSIEDTRELNLPHQNWIQAIARPGLGPEKFGEISMFDLLKDALRQRPDYIIVGEVRGEEAQTLFQAIATGHAGLSTLHADKAEDAIRRLYSSPLNVPKTQLGALDFIVFQETIKTPVGLLRRATHMIEIRGYTENAKGGDFDINPLFTYSPQKNEFSFQGRSYKLEKIKAKVTDDPKEEVEARTKLLQLLVEKKITSYSEISKIIREFYLDRQSLLAKLGSV